MIDWVKVITNSFWLVGLALLLAVAGYADYHRSLAHLSTRQVWRTAVRNGWVRLGGLLFCAGMALTGGTWLEKGVWALLALHLPYRWWNDKRARGTDRP